MSIGPRGFARFFPINSPAKMSSFRLILSTMLSRFLHYLSSEGFATSLSSGKYSSVYVSGSSNQSFESPVSLATLNAFTIIVLFVTSQWKALIVIELFYPFTLWLLISLSMIKVPWQQLFNRACVSRTLPELSYCNFIGASHILMTSVPVMTEVHFTFPWFFPSSPRPLSLFIVVFFLK